MRFVRRFINFLGICLFLGYGGYFSFLNMDRVYVNLPLVGEFRLPGFLAFLAAFLVGAFFAAFFFGYDFFRKSFEVKRSRRALTRMNKTPHQRASRFLEDEARSAQREPTV